MCPDNQIISLYLDEELPSPWKEKMEAHLESCKKCQSALAGYKNLKSSLQQVAVPQNLEKAVEAAQGRVWEKLSARVPGWELIRPVGPVLSMEKLPSMGAEQRPRMIKRVWNRRIMLPLPAAAAAVLLIIAFFALIGTRSLSRPSLPDAVTAAMPDYLQLVGDDQGILPIEDMTGVLQYLSSQEYGDFMVIRLPETRKFSRLGEPALINAADYSRRNASR